VLREAGLVRSRTDAQRRVYSVDPAGLDALEAWTATQRRFWNAQLDRLAARVQRDLDANDLPGDAGWAGAVPVTCHQSQPRSSAVRTASARLRAPALAMAADR
jgi:hypothetical protein